MLNKTSFVLNLAYAYLFKFPFITIGSLTTISMHSVDKFFLDELKLFRYEGIRIPIGQVPTIDGLTNDHLNILGFGLSGNVIASIIAVSHGSDCCYWRDSPKQHGTCRRLDGKPKTTQTVVVVAKKDLQLATRLCLELKISVLHFLVFDEIDRILGPHSITWPDPCKYQAIQSELSVSEAVEVLKGPQFKLSGGGTSQRYFDTVPAVYSYSNVNKLLDLMPDEFFGLICGAAYGATYLAAMAALRSKDYFISIDPRQKFSQNHNHDIQKIITSHEKVVIFDDFVSTSNALTTCALLFRDFISDIKFVSAYSLTNLRAHNINVICELNDRM